VSTNYSNLIERWARVEYMPMRFSPAAVDAAASTRLTLTP
jgi:acyl-homoserine lactone acylase PvdQ